MFEPPRPTDPDPRDPRVFLAAERTMLAWVRTGLALMGFGFVVARFGLFLHQMAAFQLGQAPPPGHGSVSLWAGTALVVLGVWVNLVAALRHLRFRRRFERGDPFETPRGLVTILLAMALVAVGVVMVAYLLLVAA